MWTDTDHFFQHKQKQDYHCSVNKTQLVLTVVELQYKKTILVISWHTHSNNINNVTCCITHLQSHLALVPWALNLVTLQTHNPWPLLYLQHQCHLQSLSVSGLPPYQRWTQPETEIHLNIHIHNMQANWYVWSTAQLYTKATVAISICSVSLVALN